MSEKEQEKERRIGHYTVKEWTARRLVVERKRRPLVTVGVMWLVSLPVLALIAPWMGGERIWMAVIVVLTLLVTSLLVLAFTPVRREITFDLEEGLFRMTRNYLPRRAQERDIPLAQIEKVRRRHRVWDASGEIKKVEWVIDLVDAEGKSWVIVVEDEEEPVVELSRIFADVSGHPLEKEA